MILDRHLYDNLKVPLRRIPLDLWLTGESTILWYDSMPSRCFVNFRRKGVPGAFCTMSTFLEKMVGAQLDGCIAFPLKD